jgi:hypothetical protein
MLTPVRNGTFGHSLCVPAKIATMFVCVLRKWACEMLSPGMLYEIVFYAPFDYGEMCYIQWQYVPQGRLFEKISRCGKFYQGQRVLARYEVSE